jgi:large subunit ribosomal protein L9
MQIILAEDIEGLGRAGETVRVKDGYARNFLLPKQKALLANVKNVKWLERQRAVILEKASQVRESAEAFAKSLSGVELTIEKKAGGEGKLFGSVTAADIAEALKEKGFEVDRRKISIGEPIKRLGDHTVTVKVHMEVHADVTVHVIGEDGATAPEPVAAGETAEQTAEQAAEQAGDETAETAGETAAEETADTPSTDQGA